MDLELEVRAGRGALRGTPRSRHEPNPAGASQATDPKIARVYHRPFPRAAATRLSKGHGIRTAAVDPSSGGQHDDVESVL